MSRTRSFKVCVVDHPARVRDAAGVAHGVRSRLRHVVFEEDDDRGRGGRDLVGSCATSSVEGDREVAGKSPTMRGCRHRVAHLSDRGFLPVFRDDDEIDDLDASVGAERVELGAERVVEPFAEHANHDVVEGRVSMCRSLLLLVGGACFSPA